MNQSAIPSIHGHEVLDMIAEAERPFSRAELIAEIESEFGPDARYHTCSIEGLSAAELVEFLVSRGKLHGDDEGLSLDPSKICQH
jgi:probable metal-binding protein